MRILKEIIILGPLFGQSSALFAGESTCSFETVDEKPLYQASDFNAAEATITSYRNLVLKYVESAPLKRVYKEIIGEKVGECMSDKREYILRLDASLAEMVKGVSPESLQKSAKTDLKTQRLKNASLQPIKTWANWKRPQ